MVDPAPPPSGASSERLRIYAAKTLRTFCYGYLGILLPLHLAHLGMEPGAIGLAVTLTLAGSAALTWAIRRPAERLGARRVLLALAGLSVAAACLFLFAENPWVVVLAAMLGNIAVGTGETGPFLVLEQVAVARTATARERTHALSVYNFLGYGAAALGALLLRWLNAPQPLFAIFLVAALGQAALYLGLPAVRVASRPSGAMPSAGHVRKLAALFSLDSFAGGFLTQSLVALFFHERFGLSVESLGALFAASQILAAFSLLAAARIAGWIGLLNTMVFTHLISSLALIAVAFAPTAPIAIALYLMRQSLSQMDVPTRQAYLMALVEDHEREGAAAATTLARTVTQAVSPALTGWIMQAGALGAPLAIGGVLKIVYDLTVWRWFRKVPLREDMRR
jgi:MFS family permease